MGFIFSLFDVTSAREVPFGIPQYVQCILQGLASVLLYLRWLAHNDMVFDCILQGLQFDRFT